MAGSRTPRPHRRSRILIAVLAAALLAVAGCSSRSSKASNSPGGNRAVGAAAGAAPKASGRSHASSAPDSAGGALTAKTPLQQRDIIRTATVSLRTTAVDRSANTIVGLAEPAGGRVDGDDRSSSGKKRTATLILRIPPDTLNRIIAKVDTLGTETSRSVRGEDVTASKADIAARTQALQVSVMRLRGFLSHSGGIKDLVSLENQLTERESELESMQGQQRALADQIGLATLTVQVYATPAPVPAKPRPKTAGIGSAFVSGWHALVSTARWVVKIIGYSLPITAALVLIAGIALSLWRRHRRPPKPARAS
ncbi:MAG: DUF4349 domain-containing protein [Mycobacteriales bacterium]